MKNRKHYNCNDVQIFDNCVAAMYSTYKGVPSINKPKLQGLKHSVSVRYTEYLTLFESNQLINIGASTRTVEEKISLVYLYESNNKELKKLKEHIRDSQDEHLRYICPNCGILPSNTIDHYIPKEEHPDFAILSKNLIWTCGVCNSKKLNYWKEPSHKGIINFYSDCIPKFRYLHCKISVVDGSLKANWELLESRLNNHPTIKKHYERLGLISLYNDYAPSKLGELISDISSYRGIVSHQEVLKILLRQYTYRVRNFGLNEWKASLLRALIIEKHYENYL